MESTPEALAYLIDPKPEGTRLYLKDLETERDIILLFDACQILRGTVFANGWEYLLNKFGLIGLYQIDLKSDWLDTEDKHEWLSRLLYHSLISGFNPQTGSFGKYNEDTNLFRNESKQNEIVDWERFCSRTYLLKEE